jgi:hypothetical protein
MAGESKSIQLVNACNGAVTAVFSGPNSQSVTLAKGQKAWTPSFVGAKWKVALQGASSAQSNFVVGMADVYSVSESGVQVIAQTDGTIRAG